MDLMRQLRSSRERPVVAFLTDFGQGDGDVGVMKGVVLGIEPDAQLVDITHDVAPQNIASGAWILAASYRYFPAGTVYACVVDPGVGSVRRPIALHAGDWYFVGPDNGLFSYVVAEQPLHEAVILENTTYRLSNVSSTFHGRDIFAPAAAHLAHGVPLSELGSRIDLAALQRLDLSVPTREEGRIQARVLHVDNFGNLITSIPLNIVPDLFSSRAVQLTFPEHGRSVTERRRFFSDVSVDEKDEEHPFIYGDSSGYVGVAVRNGSAAKTLHATYGSTIIMKVESGTVFCR